MEAIAQSKDKLILEDRPFIGRLISYSLIGTGLILILPSKYKPQLFMYFGLIMALGGVLIQRYLPDTVRCIFDRSKGKLTIARTRPFQKAWDEIYELAEISKIRIESQTSPQHKTRYRLALQINANSWVPLTKKFTQGDVHTLESLAKKIQDFL